jgi:hypothetical protein
VPLERCKAAGQVVWPLSVAVRFKPLPEEEQDEKNLYMGAKKAGKKDKDKFSDPEASFADDPPSARAPVPTPIPTSSSSSSSAQPEDDDDGVRTWAEAQQDKCELTDIMESSATVKAVVDDRPRSFQYNDVFVGATKQQQLYEKLVAPLTRDVMFGYSCTIFVYGQV